MNSPLPWRMSGITDIPVTITDATGDIVVQLDGLRAYADARLIVAAVNAKVPA